MNEAPEYLYGETLRCSFGFENPNKAAVLFACLLPLCWLAWSASWKVRQLWLRIPSILVSGLIFMGAGGCLLMTLSRGGVVAACVAMGYFGIRFLRGAGKDTAPPRWDVLWRQPYFWISIALLLSLVALAVWCGVVERSTAGVVGDTSVTHRLDLWKSALQMAVDNPAGFGAGNSGRQYMEWYQAADHTEGYRTLVNSYLTFLVERGWLPFGLALVALVAFWQWSAPSHASGRTIFSLCIALRASILAFLVAGIFSTTMENYWLWMIPSLCAAGLVMIQTAHGLAKYRGVLSNLRLGGLQTAGISLGITLILLGGIWILGWYYASKDPLIRSYGSRDGVGQVIAVSSRSPRGAVRLLPDPVVMGEQYGKLVQALALGAKVRVDVGEKMQAGKEYQTVKEDVLISTGKTCFENTSGGSRVTLWIAPPVPTDEQAAAVRKITIPVTLLNPEIDEDGRSGWWNSHSKDESTPRIEILPLQGVGNRIDWAWDSIIEMVKKRFADRP